MAVMAAILHQSMRARVRMSEDMRCLLCAGLDEPSRALEAWRRWKQLRDLDSVSWEEHKGLARIAVRLTELDPECQYRPRLLGLAKAHWTQSQIMLRAGVPALRLLADAGLEVMLLKGCALQVLVPQGAGPRVTSDLDILVPRADFPRAIRLLYAEGWAGRNSMEYTAASWRFKSGQGLRGGQHGNVDVHHQPLHGGRVEDEVLARMWARSTGTLFHGVSVRVPALEDLVVCSIGHAMHAVAQGELPLARFYDLMDLLSHPGFDVEAVADIAQQFAVLPVVAAAFHHLNEALPDARIATVLERLETRRGELSSWARYLVGTLNGRTGAFLQRSFDSLWPQLQVLESEAEIVPRVKVSGRQIPVGRQLGLDVAAASMSVRHVVELGEEVLSPQELIVTILSAEEPERRLRFDVSVDGEIHSRLLGSVKSGGMLRFRLRPVPEGSKLLAITALPSVGAEGDVPKFSLLAVSIP